MKLKQKQEHAFTFTVSVLFLSFWYSKLFYHFDIPNFFFTIECLAIGHKSMCKASIWKKAHKKLFINWMHIRYNICMNFVEKMHVKLKVLDIKWILWSFFFVLNPFKFCWYLSWNYGGVAGNDKNVADKIGSSNEQNAMIMICIMHIVSIVFRLVCLFDYSFVCVCEFVPEAPFVCSFDETIAKRNRHRTKWKFHRTVFLLYRSTTWKMLIKSYNIQ